MRDGERNCEMARGEPNSGLTSYTRPKNKTDTVWQAVKMSLVVEQEPVVPTAFFFE